MPMAASALDVFRGLVAEAATKLPDMVLDAGTGTVTAMIRAHTLGASVIKSISGRHARRAGPHQERTRGSH
jgi:hypothetical protein